MLFNRPRALEFMRRHGLDALVATSPVNVTYFSDYHCWMDPLLKEYMTAPGSTDDPALRCFAVFPLEGEPALVVSPMLAVNAADLWVRDLYLCGGPAPEESGPPDRLPPAVRRISERRRTAPGHATPVDALLSALQARRLTRARVGVEMRGLTAAERDGLTRALPGASVKDCTNLIRLIRAVKSKEEIACLARAAAIGEQAAMESLELARPGRPVAELAGRFRARVAALGADFDHFAYGVRGLGLALESDYVLAEDDLLYVDFGCIYRHYYSDSGTTLAMCEPPAAMLEKHAALYECVGSGAESIRPGVRASAVSRAMGRTLEARGITTSFPHGHGLGLEVRDYPILVADNGLHIRDGCVDVPSDLVLEADMVLNLESALFIPGLASLQVEQSFVVTAMGCRPLVRQDRMRPILPADIE